MMNRISRFAKTIVMAAVGLGWVTVRADEIHEAVVAWSKEHPDLANDDKKLRAFAKNEGWKNGPELLAKSDKFYGKNGVNTAGWHGWPSTMQEYYEIQPNPHDFCVTM